MPTERVPLLPICDLPPGTMRYLDIDGLPVGVAHVGATETSDASRQRPWDLVPVFGNIVAPHEGDVDDEGGGDCDLSAAMLAMMSMRVTMATMMNMLSGLY